MGDDPAVSLVRHPYPLPFKHLGLKHPVAVVSKDSHSVFRQPLLYRNPIAHVSSLFI
jgi:hypothetical protein